MVQTPVYPACEQYLVMVHWIGARGLECHWRETAQLAYDCWHDSIGAHHVCILRRDESGLLQWHDESGSGG